MRLWGGKRFAAATLGVALFLVGAVVPLARAAGGSGFRPVGRLADQQKHLSDSDGALYLDPVHRRAYTFYRSLDAHGDFLVFRVFDLDHMTSGWFDELPSIRIDADQLGLGSGDQSRLSPDGAGSERIVAVDPDTGRLFYSAEGAIYAIDAATSGAVHKWVATPNPGGVDQHTLFMPSGASVATGPAGMRFQSTAQGPRAYMIGSVQGNGTWVQAWDARASDTPSDVPEQRQLWFYPVRTCQDLHSSGTQATVFRSDRPKPDGTVDSYLYLFCNGSSDGSAVGVLRLHLSPTSPLSGASGEAAPDGQEEFFPGVTGLEIMTGGDPAAERLYIMSSNASGGRSVLVFDGRASDGRGAYIGQVALSDADRPLIGSGFSRETGRWYFQSPEGLWYQDGRLKRLAQGVKFTDDTDGGNLKYANVRPIAVDYGHNPPRVFVQRDGYYAAYEDTSPLPSTQLPPTERTTGQEESAKTVGVYTGVTSAYGMRLRLMRGLSSFWPSGTGYSLEAPPGTDRTGAPYYTSDPFFYHAGDCGTRDREVTLGRILSTELSGGLTEHSAHASGLAADPEVHHRSAPDETETRDDLGNPDLCTRQLFTAMTGADAPSSGLAGTASWPYDRVVCADNDDRSVAAGSPFVGTAHATCAATGDKPSVSAATETAVSPGDPGAFVAVQDVQTSTNTVRDPGHGLTSTATSTVRGITIAGVVHLDTIVTKAVAHAGGRTGTATHEFTRQFSGLSLAGQSICAACDQATVLETINKVLGQYGYVRAADPEPDFTLGTTKGTLSVVQKNLLQQDADATVNRDESAEWPGLEIGVYRDAQVRGGGRWIVQLGGVFAQAQFGVIDALGDAGGAVASTGDTQTFSESAIPASPVAAPQLPAPPTHHARHGLLSTLAGVPWKLLKQELAGIGFALTNPAGAALLGTLWCLLCSPAYLATRRRLLNEVMEPAMPNRST